MGPGHTAQISAMSYTYPDATSISQAPPSTEFSSQTWAVCSYTIVFPPMCALYVTRAAATRARR
jgi:hypothetical protein